MSRFIALAIVCCLAATEAQASAPPKDEKKKDGASNLEMAPVALPVVVDGQVVNYVFATVKINLSATADLAKWRAREPYIRDAVVKTAHRTPFTRPDDYLSLDETRLKASVQREAAAVMGGKDIKSVVVVQQIPKKRTGVPRPRVAQRALPAH